MKITLEDITAVELLAVAKVLNNVNDEIVTPSNAPVVVDDDEIINEPTGDTMDFDKEGLPWDERIHSSNHKLTAQGVWQRRRGVSDEVYNAVKAELLGKWEAAEPVVEDNNPHLETTILAPSFEPVQAPVVAPAPVAPAPVQAFVPVQQPQAPVAAPAPVVAPAPVAPAAPAPSTFETFSSKLQYALANKLIEANYMQGVLNTVNATFGTNYQGMFEMRDNENAMLFVINELAKKGI